MSTVTNPAEPCTAHGSPPRIQGGERALIRRAITTLAVCVSLSVAGCAADDSESGSAAPTTPTQSSTVSAAAGGAGGANTAEVVAAADAFLATLSDEQRDTVLYDFGDGVKKTGWSNFPVQVVKRNGIAFGDLTDKQKAAALAVMEAALSDQGYEELLEIRKSDNFLNALQKSGNAKGGRGGGMSVSFGEDLNYLAFFGEPGKAEQFMIQYGGHHAAYNITYAGENVSLSPTLTAIEPSQFELEGKSYAPLEDKRSSVIAAIQALSESELAKAEISGSFDDLLLGPGNDGPFPEPEGVLVGDLTKDQQDKVTAILRVWVDDLDEEAAEALIAKYVSEYDRTYLGWSGGTTLDNAETYVRVDGPSAWIEFSNQPGAETSGIHQHTIFRDQTADYGWN